MLLMQAVAQGTESTTVLQPMIILFNTELWNHLKSLCHSMPTKFQ